MSRKRIKRKTPKIKDLKKLRKRIQKDIIDIDKQSQSETQEQVDAKNRAILDEFCDIT